ncbi:MAG TPA: undecaprenyl-diphosphate phosphatase, partial [Pseudonocardiaceae bacterium]|nr:undecaprenyl-diphosphate phosphatase [Pseudonocardiaceae bacterium]
IVTFDTESVRKVYKPTLTFGQWDAARFSFLLATPVILAAGVLKIPDLFGALGRGIHGQVLAGSLASGVAAYLSVRFLTRYFRTRTLTPFAIYCFCAGLVGLAWLTMR